MQTVWNEDYHDVLAALVNVQARFLVVGAHALAAHGLPRATVDIDLWIDRSAENAGCVWRALVAFGAPLEDLGISENDLTTPDMVVQIGVPPHRIDILTGISGILFATAWANRIEGELEGVRIPILSRSDLIANKLATGRMKDRADIEALERKA